MQPYDPYLGTPYSSTPMPYGVAPVGAVYGAPSVYPVGMEVGYVQQPMMVGDPYMGVGMGMGVGMVTPVVGVEVYPQPVIIGDPAFAQPYGAYGSGHHHGHHHHHHHHLGGF